jgi:putative flippase GtrA
MSDEFTTSVQLPFHHRVRVGVRKPHNWLQLIRFAAVGATGYVVNLAVFAYVVSVLNNFFWNRHWTFRAKEGHAVHQGLRFFAVSLVTFGFSYLVLVMLVSGAGVHKDLAQAVSVAIGMPLNFVGQKLWSFKL